MMALGHPIFVDRHHLSDRHVNIVEIRPSPHGPLGYIYNVRSVI